MGSWVKISEECALYGLHVLIGCTVLLPEIQFFSQKYDEVGSVKTLHPEEQYFPDGGEFDILEWELLTRKPHQTLNVCASTRMSTDEHFRDSSSWSYSFVTLNLGHLNQNFKVTFHLGVFHVSKIGCTVLLPGILYVEIERNLGIWQENPQTLIWYGWNQVSPRLCLRPSEDSITCPSLLQL
jgi:hypothetical protein